MNRILVATLSAVMATVVVALGFRLFDDAAGPRIVIEDPPLPTEIVVQIAGAVATPGVYVLPVDARFADAIDAAGGLAPDADIAAVNLARRVPDEASIVIPRRGEVPAAPETSGEAAAVSAPADRLVDINTATAAELDALPGIGEVIAQRIVDARAAGGPFESVEDLAAIDGISRGMVDELRPLVIVGP